MGVAVWLVYLGGNLVREERTKQYKKGLVCQGKNREVEESILFDQRFNLAVKPPAKVFGFGRPKLSGAVLELRHHLQFDGAVALREPPFLEHGIDCEWILLLGGYGSDAAAV